MANRKTLPALQLLTGAILMGCWFATFLSRQRRQRPARPGYFPNKKELTAASAALLLADAVAIPAVLRAKRIIGGDELGQLQEAGVAWYDRHALGFSFARREPYRRISDKLLLTMVAAPFALLMDARIRADGRAVATMYAWTQALSYTIYSFSPLGPAFIDKFRPVVFYHDFPAALRNAANNRNARFSGHTANGTAAVFFIARILHHFHPRRSPVQKASDYLFAFGMALTLGWLRTRALKHFPSDVLQAMLIGGCCGLMIPKLYERPPADRSVDAQR